MLTLISRKLFILRNARNAKKRPKPFPFGYAAATRRRVRSPGTESLNPKKSPHTRPSKLKGGAGLSSKTGYRPVLPPLACRQVKIISLRTLTHS